MGLCLIAVTFDLSLLLVIVEVAVALGMVIFVHELGHFAVAKLCGVKCEKFYLGFDIAGLRLCRFTWGETEYGIGILPLGGYVKMLGQEDNPARLKEEIERAKQNQAAGPDQTADASSPAATEADWPQDTGTARKDPEADQDQGGQIDVEAAERALYDPRSYLAQSVPKRMAIISAGVVMNVIFAFVIAVIAYRMGVKQVPCGVSEVFPGEAAWKAGIRVGDRISKIGGEKVKRFRDLQKRISVGDIDDGVAMTISRPDPAHPGIEKEVPITVFPDRIRVVPTIGIGGPLTTTLREEGKPAAPGSPAALAEGGFEGGDRVVALATVDAKGIERDKQPITSYAQFDAYLARNPAETLAVTVERPVKTEHAETETPETITIKVAPSPMRRLGLVMEMGEICAIQADAPEPVRKQIKPGDKILKIDFNPPQEPGAAGNPEPPGDPITLPERLRRLAGKRIRFYVERGGKQLDRPIDVTLRQADWYETPLDENQPMSVPVLGIAYRVGHTVEKVLPGSPAAEVGMHQGDVVVEATLLPADAEMIDKYGGEQRKQTLEFGPEHQNWPLLMTILQKSLPGSRVRLECLRKGDNYTATLTATLRPDSSEKWFDPDRGFRFEQDEFPQVAESWREAVRLGAEETIEALTLVLQILRKIGTQISFRAFGGPGTIATVAGRAAQEGIPKLLLFLTLLSANLAVLNFLPIPLLDGGHMVFLTWEAIRGKPADQRVQVALTYLGLLIILTLMIWVIGLDIVRLVSWLLGF